MFTWPGFFQTKVHFLMQEIIVTVDQPFNPSKHIPDHIPLNLRFFYFHFPITSCPFQIIIYESYCQDICKHIVFYWGNLSEDLSIVSFFSEFGVFCVYILRKAYILNKDFSKNEPGQDSTVIFPLAWIQKIDVCICFALSAVIELTVFLSSLVMIYWWW